jgi:hypothetical protein
MGAFAVTQDASTTSQQNWIPFRISNLLESWHEYQVKTTHQALLVSLVLVVLEAFATPRTATAYDKAAFVAPEEEALVVFIQNLREDRTMSYVIFDPDRQCVAQVGDRQALVVPIQPGQYMFYVSGYNIHRIELDLEAGRTYFIRFYSIEKFATRISDVTLVQRGAQSYTQVKNWLEGATVTHAIDDRCRGKPLQERPKRTQKRINEANASWKNGDELYRFKYKLLKEDGLTAEEIGWL